MANLSTRFMGLTLDNPIIAGASDLTVNMDSIKRIEQAGAGALVLKSLFEEQIQLSATSWTRTRTLQTTSILR